MFNNNEYALLAKNHSEKQEWIDAIKNIQVKFKKIFYLIQYF